MTVPYYRVLVNGATIYACTDEYRFIREISKHYANVGNAVLSFPDGEVVGKE